MPKIYKCSQCGKEVPFVNTLYHYRAEQKTTIDFCTECFDGLLNSMKLKPEYIQNIKK